MASRRPTDSPRSPATPTPDPGSPPPATKAKAPTVRKPRAKKAATTTKVPAALASLEITEDVRRGMIAQAAYLRAERRGFMGGHDKEREDWLAAEAEVDALLKAGQGTSAQ
jgi:Protein of unknown function (DUF2934)